MTSTKTAETLADLSPGGIVGGRYEIVRHLGAGGFATVFAAFDRDIEREVAMKILNMTTMAGGDQEVDLFLERFRREAKLAARIRHPNVVEIYDFGIFGRRSNPYIVMEMLSGHDLEEEISSAGGMDPKRALPLFGAALEALGEAHRLGIVHKDLKPANLFINNPGTRREVLKVVDFGIAHMGESDEGRMTQTGAMFGTPQYLSPEYVQAQVVTPGMDVYQMGLILVEMLTGRVVVSETNPWQCAVKHVTRDINLPAELLDGPLGPVVRKALEYEVDDRFRTATEFADALAEVDPASVGDVSQPGIPFRRIDNTSGQFVPADQQDAHLGLRSTGQMQKNGSASQTDQMPTRLSSAFSGEPRTERVPDDETFTFEYPESEGKRKKAYLLVGLLIAILLAAGILAKIMNQEPGDIAEPEELAGTAQLQNSAPVELLDQKDRNIEAAPTEDPALLPGDEIKSDKNSDENKAEAAAESSPTQVDEKSGERPADTQADKTEQAEKTKTPPSNKSTNKSRNNAPSQAAPAKKPPAKATESASKSPKNTGAAKGSSASASAGAKKQSSTSKSKPDAGNSPAEEEKKEPAPAEEKKAPSMDLAPDLNSGGGFKLAN